MSSFDIFLVIDVGFPLKIFFVVSLGAILIWLTKFDKIKIKMIGLGYFITWFLFLLTFIGNTNLLAKNIVYQYILFHYFIVILMIADVVNSELKIIKLFRYYIYSFLFVGIFGLIQFFASLAGVSLLTAQYWIEGSLGRINGFSYEPSYFATYMLLGWGTLFIILNNKKFDYNYWQISKQFLKRVLQFMSLVIVLSSSRMGILIIIVLTFISFIYRFIKLLMKRRVSKYFLTYPIVAIGFTVVAIIYLPRYFETYSFLLSGTGIGGTASHSVDDRNLGAENSLAVAKKSIFVGVGLGGVQSALAGSHGVVIRKPEDAIDFEIDNVFIEIFAASSFAGFVFFMLYLYSMYSKWFLLESIAPQYRVLFSGLLFGLLINLLLLILNENILRSYLWMQIALLNAVYYIGSKKQITEFNQNNVVVNVAK